MQSVEDRVKGRIDQHWSDWFEDLTITHTQEDETVLRGSVADQAALYGLPGQAAGPGFTAYVGELRGREATILIGGGRPTPAQSEAEGCLPSPLTPVHPVAVLLAAPFSKVPLPDR